MLRRRLSPEDVISAIYEEEGFYEVERGSDPESLYTNRLILSDGKREIVINILSEDSFANKGALQDVLLHAEKLKSKFDGVCIAVPRKYMRALDEDVMSLHGFGLIIYDNLGAEEVIPPRIREKRKPVEKARDEAKIVIQDNQEIVRLRSEISRLLRILEEVEARLDRLENEQRSLARKLSRIEATISRSGVKEELTESREVEAVRTVEAKKGNLPSYLRDNPWVEILSRRE